MRYNWMGPVLVGLVVAGCTKAPAPSTEATAAAASQQASDDGPIASAVAEIPLEIKSWDELQQWIAGQTNKVVVIDVWSTFCLTCVQEFPHFVELHQKYGNKVACASLSVDFYGGQGNQPEDVRPQVMKFLTSQQATMQNFISSDADETVLGHIDTVAIPAALIYDRQGKLHKVFNNDDDEFGPDGFNYQDHIEPLVQQLLSSNG